MEKPHSLCWAWAVSRSKPRTATRCVFWQPQPALLFPREARVHGPGAPSPLRPARPTPRLSRTVHGLPHGVQAGGVARHGDPAAPGTGTRRARPSPPAPRDGPAQRERGGGGLSLNSCGGAAGDWAVRERGSPAIGPAEHTALCDWSQSSEGAGPVKGPPGAAGAGAGAARRRRPDNGGRWLCPHPRHSRLLPHSGHRLLARGAWGSGEWLGAVAPSRGEVWEGARRGRGSRPLCGRGPGGVLSPRSSRPVEAGGGRAVLAPGGAGAARGVIAAGPVCSSTAARSLLVLSWGFLACLLVILPLFVCVFGFS